MQIEKGLNSSPEKRLYPRVACRLPIVGEQSDPKIDGTITDLSLKGMRVRTVGPIRVGETYRLSFILPPFPKPIKVESKALNYLHDHANNTLFGFRIHNISQKDAKVVKQFILEQMSIDQRKVVQKVLKHLNSDTINSFADRAKIEGLLSRAQLNQSSFTIVQEDKSQSVSCRLSKICGGNLEFACLDDYIRRNFDISVPVIVAFSTEFNSYHFETFLTAAEDFRVQLETPRTLFFSEKRSRDREPIESQGKVNLEIPLPYPKGKLIQREVLDLSSTGLSFKTFAHENYFLPGTPLREVRIISEGKKVFTESAEVKHITPLLGENSLDCLKIGLEFGIDRQNVVLTKSDVKLEERTGTDRREVDRRQEDRRRVDRRQGVFRNFSKLTRRIASQGFHYYRYHWLGFAEPRQIESPVDIVTYSNQRNEEIVAILNTTFKSQQKIKAPVVIIPPAYGRRKETTGSLALTLIENFKRHRQDVVVLRFDGIRCIGESYKDPSCRFDGKETINMTLSQGMEDILTTLDFVYDNPRFAATEVILVSFSLTACMARRALIADAKKRVGYWITAWGATDAQEAIRNATGGLDFIGNYQKGISCGVTNVLGHLIDNDRFCSDAIKSGMAFLDDAKRDMAKIEIPATWLYGKYDEWINPGRIHDIMSIKAKGTREVVELPTGHMPTTNEEALETYRLITKYIWRYLFVEDVKIQDPSPSALVKLRNAEWSRAPKSGINDQADYWEKYLLGRGQLEIGFDVMAETQEYQEFMKKQIELLEIHSGELIGDLGSGTGLFNQMLLNTERQRRLFRSSNGRCPKILTVDFVNSALEKSKLRLSHIAAQHYINENSFEFTSANLEVSRLKPIWRFLNGEYFSVIKLKGKIEGLPDYSVDLWAKDYSEFLHETLRGKNLTSKDVRRLHKEFSHGEAEIILDMNRAARFVLRKLVVEDFKDPRQFRYFLEGSYLNHLKVDTSSLRFEKLNFRKSTLNFSIPFQDGQFDKILSSIVLSYLFNPQESLQEFYRMLKPGGRLVVSTFRPDVDMSRVYTRLIQQVENDPDYVTPNGMAREDFLNAVRSFANSAAFLLHLEEEGHFRFFSRAELKGLLEAAGFEIINLYDSFGYPPQAYIAACSK